MHETKKIENCKNYFFFSVRGEGKNFVFHSDKLKKNHYKGVRLVSSVENPAYQAEGARFDST